LKRLRNQKGAAIIVALFVVALVAAAATIMIERLRTDTRRTELTLNANAAYLYAQGSVAWAIDTLNNDWTHQQPNTVIDKTPITSPVDHQNEAVIQSIISDAQGYFNINNLTDPNYQINFMRLIMIVAPETSLSDAQNITLATMDWIAQGSKNPTLDEYYLKQNPPYKAAHQIMLSPSELRLVKGMTPKLYDKLAPYIIALPNATQININNAGIPVLMCLSMTLSQQSAKSLSTAIQANPFADIQTFMNNDIVKNNPFESSKITTTSNYFLLQTNVKVGDQTLTLYTMLNRVTQGTQAKTVVLWQSKGTL
jgi:general secretion pathway protein K